MARLEDIRDALAAECMAETLAGAELRADIQQTLLPDEYQCFWLWLEGFPVREIAVRTQLPRATAYDRIRAAAGKVDELL